MSKQFDPAENDLPEVLPAEASSSTDTNDVLNGETARDSEREQDRINGEDEEQVKPRSRRSRGTRAARGARSEAMPEGILQLPVRNDAQVEQQCDEADECDETVVVAELEAQGFTPDEAIRLVHVSGRVATSREAQEAEATLRRLRFTRWLVERGMLDEFSA